MATKQQKWNRYVDAINYCTAQGLLIDFEYTKGGNIKYLKAKFDWRFYVNSKKDMTIKLKPKKYKPTELYNIIISYLGNPIVRKEYERE